MESKVKFRTCEHCVFSVCYQDMGASIKVCSLYHDLSDAEKAVKNVSTCKHKITRDDLIKIVEDKYGAIPKID